MSLRSRFWAYLTAPGVFWWGLPVMLTTAIWTHGRRHGFTFASFWSVGFLVWLVVAVVFGVIGGNVFGRTMKRHRLDLGVLDGKDPEPPV